MILNNVGIKPCHKPPMTGNGKHATYKHGDDRGMVRLWHCFSHITPVMGFLQSWGIPSGRGLLHPSHSLITWMMTGGSPWVWTARNWWYWEFWRMWYLIVIDSHISWWYMQKETNIILIADLAIHIYTTVLVPWEKVVIFRWLIWNHVDPGHSPVFWPIPMDSPCSSLLIFAAMGTTQK